MHGRQEWNMAALWLAIVMVLASAAFYVPQRVVQAADPASAIQSRLAPSLPVRLLNAITPPAGADGIGLVDPTSGVWHLRTRGGDPAVFYFGVPGDFPIMGDWDCNGTATPGLYRQSDGFVYLRNSNTQGVADIRFFFGIPGDIPLAGDFNGNGCDTISIYRPSEARIYVINELGSNDGGLGFAEYSYLFGDVGDKPFTGDFNGNGIDTVGLHRESSGFVYFRNSNTQGVAEFQFFFGDPNDRLVAGDWTGDGKDSPALFRPSNKTVYLRYTNTQGNANEDYTWGNTPYIPVSGDFGVLNSGVNVNLSGAPDGLEYAVESFYQELPNAPHLPSGLRSHLGGLDDRPKSQTVTGSASTSVAYGKHVGVVTAGSDTLLAVSDNGWEWRIVGAHPSSKGRARWYGDEPRHVVLIGADWQQTSGGSWPISTLKTNADSVHILSLRPSLGKGTLTGFPRDTLVRASFGTVKMSKTMENHGPQFTVGALKTETGLPIEGYFHIGMGSTVGGGGPPPGFLDLVDAYGGFPFTVPYAAGPASVGDTFVDGAKALAFGRERKTLPHGDVDRTLGQGLLIKAAIAEIRKGSILTIPSLLALMDDFVNTNLSVDDILTIAAATYVVDPGAMPTLTAADLAAAGHTSGASISSSHGPYNQNVGGLPNVMIKGCFLAPSSWKLVSGNYGTFGDLADGLLSTLPPYHCP